MDFLDLFFYDFGQCKMDNGPGLGGTGNFLSKKLINYIVLNWFVSMRRQ